MIKAKSVRGYRTNNRKWTENKFKVSLAKLQMVKLFTATKEGEPKPELMEDGGE